MLKGCTSSIWFTYHTLKGCTLVVMSTLTVVHHYSWMRISMNSVHQHINVDNRVHQHINVTFYMVYISYVKGLYTLYEVRCTYAKRLYTIYCCLFPIAVFPKRPRVIFEKGFKLTTVGHVYD